MKKEIKFKFELGQIVKHKCSTITKKLLVYRRGFCEDINGGKSNYYWCSSDSGTVIGAEYDLEEFKKEDKNLPFKYEWINTQL